MPASGGGDDVGDDGLAGGGIGEFLLKSEGAGIQALNHEVGLIEGGVGRHLDPGADHIAVDGREGDESEVTALPVASEGDGDGDESGEGGVAKLKDEVEDGLEHFCDKEFQAVGDFLLKALEQVEALAVAIGAEVLEVAGENEFGLDEGEEEDGGDDGEDGLGVGGPGVGHEHERDEGDDGGDDSEGDGGGHFLGSLNGGFGGFEAFAEFGVNIFAGHDGVVDHDS